MIELSCRNLKPAAWRANYVLKPDMKLLHASLRDYGWMSPLIVRESDYTIIDGFHRWLLAGEDPELIALGRNVAPVVLVDCDEVEAMIMHVRLNRGRGNLIAKRLSRLLQRCMEANKLEDEQLRAAVGMSADEFDRLAQGDLIKVRKIADHKYSNAWIPVEAPPAGARVSGTITIERPPNPDR